MAKSGKVKSGKSIYNFKKIQLDILRVLKSNPEGLRVRTICKLLSSPQRTIYRHINKLVNDGIITTSYPIYKIQALSEKWQTLLKDDNIQQHRFSFVLQLISKPSWWHRRAGKLMKLKDYYFMKNCKWGNNRYQQLLHNNFIIQTFNSSIVVINQNKYWGPTAYDCFIESLEATLEVFGFMEESWNINLIKDGVPHLNVKSHEYVDMKDELARRCEKTKKGFFVEINGVKRAWVDFSIPFGLEFGSRIHAPEDQAKYSRYVSDIIENNAPLTSELDDRISKLTGIIENQQQLINQLLYKPVEKLDPRDRYFG